MNKMLQPAFENWIFRFIFSLNCAALLPFYLVLFVSHTSKAQDPCSYQTHSKKGSAWVFSTYYQPNTQIPLEGVCEQKNGNAPFLYRSFQAGRLKKEVRYSSENKLLSSLEIFDKKRDSIIGEYKNFKEDGILLYHEVYFLDKNRRRCMHRKSYHINGKPRFDQYFAWIRASELNEYQKPSHPPHTIDDDGYTYLLVPFGKEMSFDETGQLLEEKHHQLLIDGTHEFSSLQGPCLKYHHNGQLKEKMVYKSGKLHGDFVSYNFLGDMTSKGSYDNGIKNGVWTYWHDNGKLKARHVHNTTSNFPFHAQKEEWSEKGSRVLLFSFDELGNGMLQEWTENGVLIHEQELVNLSIDKGKEKFWFPSGQMKSLMNHTSRADTVYHEWYESGQEKILKRQYDRGNVKVTSNQEWYANGKLKDEVILERSEYVNIYMQTKYFENGNLSFRDIRKNKEQIVEEYAQNGIKIRTKQLLDGKIHGRFQELDSTGQITLDISYQNGLRHGAYRLYKKGLLSYEAYYENGVWIPKDEKTKPFFTAYQKLSASEKEIYVSAAYHVFNNLAHTPEPIQKSNAARDSLAAIIWQMNRLAPHYSAWTSNSLVKNQVLKIRLIESYHRDLQLETVNSEFSKELLAGLEQLKVKLPGFKFVNGEAEVTIELNQWINMAMIRQIFPKNQSLIHVYNPLKEEKSKYLSRVRYTIEQKTTNCWKVTIQNQMDVYHVLLYGDGTVEIENQLFSWAEFLKMDLTTQNPYREWMFED